MKASQRSVISNLGEQRIQPLGISHLDRREERQRSVTRVFHVRDGRGCGRGRHHRCRRRDLASGEGRPSEAWEGSRRRRRRIFVAAGRVPTRRRERGREDPSSRARPGPELGLQREPRRGREEAEAPLLHGGAGIGEVQDRQRVLRLRVVLFVFVFVDVVVSRSDVLRRAWPELELVNVIFARGRRGIEPVDLGGGAEDEREVVGVEGRVEL
mmetsp:Transcript_20568/g.44160  ORF Transcript_20568/g.44160 Transcript_20568/m.44160 type:complete len:212 (+) Transcript_20568:427-1062(+)